MMNVASLPTQRIEQPAPIENGWFLFFGITTLSVVVAFAGQHLLLSDELYFNALAEQMTFEQIQGFLDQTHQWAWLTYVILPLFNLIKFTLERPVCVWDTTL